MRQAQAAKAHKTQVGGGVRMARTRNLIELARMIAVLAAAGAWTAARLLAEELLQSLRQLELQKQVENAQHLLLASAEAEKENYPS